MKEKQPRASVVKEISRPLMPITPSVRKLFEIRGQPGLFKKPRPEIRINKM